VPRTRIKVGLEIADKKVFAAALDWPGWCRSGRDREAALEALSRYAERYAPVLELAGQSFDVGATPALDIVEELPGNASTSFGVPDARFEADSRRVTTAEGERLAAIVEASWTILDRIAATAPAELRKGPRGGGRDRDQVVAHVTESDGGYARVLGIKHPDLDPSDRPARDALRAQMLDVLRQPSDGAPIAGKKWPPRYAARRIAWHALDHAWEIEDRSEPAG
jgi:hypothetical protein